MVDLEPADLILGDGAGVNLNVTGPPTRTPSGRGTGGVVTSVPVRDADGMAWILKGGARLYTALYPILAAAPSFPVLVRVSVVGDPGSTDRMWSVTIPEY